MGLARSSCSANRDLSSGPCSTSTTKNYSGPFSMSIHLLCVQRLPSSKHWCCHFPEKFREDSSHWHYRTTTLIRPWDPHQGKRFLLLSSLKQGKKCERPRPFSHHCLQAGYNNLDGPPSFESSKWKPWRVRRVMPCWLRLGWDSIGWEVPTPLSSKLELLSLWDLIWLLITIPMP